MIFVVFLSGYLQSGKDTVGNYLVERFNFKRVAFADILKDEVSELYNIPRSLLDTTEGKTVENRSKLIKHGAKRRAENLNYWIDKIIENIRTSKQNVVITDWRFAHEFNVIRDTLDVCTNFTLFTWRINRWDAPPLVDSTENSLDRFEFDTCIENKYGLENLYNVVRETLLKLKICKLFVTDVDDTLMDWFTPFNKWFNTKGYKFVKTPSKFADFIDCVEPTCDLLDFIIEFNDSEHFTKLNPMSNACETLVKLKHDNYIVYAASSCNTPLGNVEQRTKHIVACFPHIFDKIMILPIGYSKY